MATVNSAEWWLDTLHKRLAARLPALNNYARYYEGDHPLLFATEKFRQAFGRQFGSFADNWCQIVADSVVERLQVDGFRLGTNAKADTKLWEIWQANQLDADSELGISDAVTLGDSSVLVWPGDPVPRITVESPFQMIVAQGKGDRRMRAAALKVWVEDDGYAHATLYLPDFLYKYRSKSKVVEGAGANDGAGSARWDKRLVDGESWPLKNPLGVVPVVPLVNKPSLLDSCGRSELEPVIPIQDAVNKLCADMIVASEFGSFRQRWATGVDIPVDPETNQPIDDFKTAIGKVWRTPNTEARFGDFEQTDLGQFVSAIEMFVQHIASQTRTPPHYFNSFGGQFPSGEALRSAETGLVAKARRKMRHFGEAFEEVMKLALQASGDRRTRKLDSMEVIWRDPESQSEAEHVDAIVKQKALNVPDEVLWEKIGYSPQEIERMREMRDVQPPAPAQPDVVDEAS
jgi:hypothetical protein